MNLFCGIASLVAYCCKRQQVIEFYGCIPPRHAKMKVGVAKFGLPCRVEKQAIGTATEFSDGKRSFHWQMKTAWTQLIRLNRYGRGFNSRCPILVNAFTNIERSNEVRAAHIAMRARASLFRRFTYTYDIYGTDSVKIWKTRHKMSVDSIYRFFLTVYLLVGSCSTLPAVLIQRFNIRYFFLPLCCELLIRYFLLLFHRAAKKKQLCKDHRHNSG